MTGHPDILDQRERLGGAAVLAVVLHVSIVALGIAYTLYSRRMVEPFGDPHAAAGTAVAVTPVESIPIPRRQGPENPVANDTQSVVPTTPEQKQTVQREQPKAAIEIPDKTKPLKKENQERRRSTYVQPTKENQIASRMPQAAVNQMYNMNAGSHGVGIGPNSPLGQRFGWYAEMIRKIIARNWTTNGLSAQQGAPAVIGFTINRDGSIRDVRIAQSSGNPAIDNSAWRAVLNSNPLPALPPQYTESTAPAEFTFDLR